MIILLAVLALIAVAAAVTAAAILALGSLLSRFFAVTTFEASAIVAGAALLWLVWIGWSGPAVAAADEAETAEERQPVVILDSLPLPPRRRSRQRKRS
jgi:hypothetical protein